MSLLNTYGNTVEKNERPKILNPLHGVEVDYYFTASLFADSKTEVSMIVWTVVVDYEGFVYGLRTRHIGNYKPWKELLLSRIESHLNKLNIDSLQVRRMVRDIEIKKEGHIIAIDTRRLGNNIGIDGSTDLYIRKDKFSFLK
ncbi:hypothetical protein [Christiangramia portivictoriae]|uniref:hypothetical protein n=1 Tax=Christiangramia portivictoriae TaxID=326069 RepID=UPI0003F66639|nr:hypothetical protein [Christiangramia portivictoriae]